MQNHIVAVPHDHQVAPKRLFELKTIFAAANENVVSFETKPHPLAKRLVSLLIYDEGDKVLLLERFNVKQGISGDRWFDLPGGKMEPGETVGVAAMREAEEELGIDITAMETICESYAPPCKMYPNGLVKYFINVLSYEGTPHNKLGIDEGHISLKAYDLDDAAAKLNGRLCGYSESYLHQPPAQMMVCK
jgi:8-oxo-dGTP pyrophosphatase MutT (NUDIX family)